MSQNSHDPQQNRLLSDMPPLPDNRPGLDQIAYRIGDYDLFLKRMLAYLPKALQPIDDPTGTAPLAKLTTRDADDGAIALLDAWAVVAEVLTFYQERIANEGYLQTATERLSVLQLARTIGYELNPGVAASTRLAFTVEEAPGSPDVVLIPKGTQVMSVPVKDELPQTFETLEDFTAHREWNALKPRPQRPQHIEAHTRQLYLSGTSTQLIQGDVLLVIDHDPDVKGYLLILTTVNENADGGYTLVTWDQILPVIPPTTTIEKALRNPKVFAFRQKVRLFGHNAPLWENVPAETKLAAIAASPDADTAIQGGVFRLDTLTPSLEPGWSAASDGLPNSDILCLALDPQGVFVGTPNKGVFRSLDQGESWSGINEGLTSPNVLTLHISAKASGFRGAIFAGTPNGGVFRSKDQGQNWVAINTGTVRVEGQGDNNWQSVNTSLPNTVVRSLLTVSYEPPSTLSSDPEPDDYLFVGTDEGIYASTNYGQDWAFQGEQSRTIYALHHIHENFAQRTGTQYIFAGTDAGIFYSGNFGSSWRQIELTQEWIVYDIVDDRTAIFLGTDAGVFRLTRTMSGQMTLSDTSQIDTTFHELAQSTVRSLTITYHSSQDGTIRYLVAATNHGVFAAEIVDGDSFNWQRISNDLATQDMTAIASITNANINTPPSPVLFAGAKFAGFTPEEVQQSSTNALTPEPTNETESVPLETTKADWPDLNIQVPQQLDLETLYPQILPGSWVVTMDDRNPKHPEQQTDRRVSAHSINQVSSIDRTDFGLGGKITRLELDTPVNPDHFGIRSTIVLAQSEAIALAPEPLTVGDRQHDIFADPISDKTLYLNEFVHNLQAEQPLIVRGQHMRALLKDVGGILRSQYDWRSGNDGLTHQPINTLVRGASAQILVGAGDGLYQSDDDGETWAVVSPLLKYTSIRTVLSVEYVLLVGGDRHLYRSDDNGTTWSQSTTITDTTVWLLTRNGETLFAGTDRGLYQSTDQGQTWQSIEAETFWDQQVRCIRLSGDNLAQVGTATGLYERIDGGWTKISAISGSVTVLLTLRDGIIAGTRQGIYRTPRTGMSRPWQLLRGLCDRHILSLATQDDYLYAGTDQGIYRTTLDDIENAKWEAIDAGLPALQGRSLLISSESDNRLLVGTEQGLFWSPSGGCLRHPLTPLSNTINSQTPGIQAQNNQLEWGRSNTGLANSQILTLTPSPDHTVIMAGTTQGVFRSTNGGHSWEPLIDGLRDPDTAETLAVPALIAVPSDATTSEAHPDNPQSPHSLVWLAGTMAGVFWLDADKRRWVPFNEKLVYLDVQTIAYTPTGRPGQHRRVRIGTRNGGLIELTSATLQGEWQSTTLSNTHVQAIESLEIPPHSARGSEAEGAEAGAIVFVGTRADGIFRSDATQTRWQKITHTFAAAGRLRSQGNAVTWTLNEEDNNFLQQGDVIHALGQTRTIVTFDQSPASAQSAASAKTFTIDQPFQPDLPADTSFAVETGLTSRNITAIKIGYRETEDEQQEGRQKEAIAFVGTAGSGVFRSYASEVGDPDIPGDRWEQVITGLDDLEIRCLAIEERDVSSSESASLEPSLARSAYSSDQQPRTRVILWAGTARGGVFRSEDEGDHWVAVNHNLTNTDIRSMLVFQPSQRRPASLLLGGIGFLVSDDGLQVKPVQKLDQVEVRHPPVNWKTNPQGVPITQLDASGGDASLEERVRQQEELSKIQRWSLRDREGFHGTLDTPYPRQDLELLPADPESSFISEMVVLDRPPTDQQQPRLLFQKAIQQSYDPSTVSVLANIVNATHGQTETEVLGSGDGHQTHQSFTLKKPPVTFIPAANARGSETTLRVRVNNVLWQEAPALYGLKGHDTNYVVRIEDDGTTSILFGDGIQGARLPTGDENITATYRSGIGLEGNVGADSLSILKTRPLGIAEVTNPLAATGAANPERLADARTKAPSTVRTLDRIVSLDDFEDFALGFAGIGKAQAVPLWNGETQIVHITVAGVNGAAVLPTSNLYRQLVTAMNNARDPLQQMEVDSYILLRFNLEARIVIDDRYLPEVIQGQIEAAIDNTFSFDYRAFGQAVTSAEVIAIIQGIEGVIAVDLDALYQRDRSRTLERTLETSPAQFNPRTGAITPAQLLLSNPAGIQLIIGGAL